MATQKISLLFAFILALQIATLVEGAVTKPPNKVNKGKTGRALRGTCWTENFEKVSKCCKSAPLIFFDRLTLTGCPKLNTGANMQIATDYNLNRLQYDNKTLVLGIKGDPVRIGKNAFCFAECAFQNLTLIDDTNAVSIDALKAYIADRITNEYWQTTLGEAIDTCQTAVETIQTANEATKTVNVDGNNFKTCQTAPGLLLQCLLGTVLKSCKDEDKITTNVCVTQLQKFETCDAFTEVVAERRAKA